MWKVGDVVYRPYLPQNPGAVIKVFDPPARLPDPAKGYRDTPPIRSYEVEVRWLDKTKTYEQKHQLNDFLTLIEDHRRRLRKHTGKLLELERSLAED